MMRVIRETLFEGLHYYYRIRTKLRQGRSVLDNVERYRAQFYKDMWEDAACHVGADIRCLGGEFFEIRKSDRMVKVWRADTTLSNLFDHKLTGNKPLIAKILSDLNVPIPRYRAFDKKTLSLAMDFFQEIEGTVVVKPADGTGGGNSVVTNITSRSGIVKAAANARATGQSMLTEELVSFRINGSTGGLTKTGTVKLKSDPCYLSLDRTGRYLFSAYYRAGAVASHAINPDGTIVEKPHAWIRTKRYAHAIQTDPSNRFAFIPHIGRSNRILQYIFDAESGRLRPNKPKKLVPREMVGPRHFCFHPHRDWVYVSNEQGSSVTHYGFDGTRGILETIQTISTLRNGFEGDNTCSQIHIHPAGSLLFVSNRGHDSISCFAVDQDKGKLTLLDQHPTERMPRAFGLDPEGRYLYVAGQISGNLACYRIDQGSGRLEHVATSAVGNNPLWVTVLRVGE